MPFLELSTCKVNYLDKGEGDVLLFLHALPGDSLDFDYIFNFYSLRYRVVALDWPGFGLSERPKDVGSISFEFYNRVVTEFIEKLGLSNVIVVGNSLGGNLGVRLAIDKPSIIRGLVLISPGGFSKDTQFKRIFCALQASRLSIPPWIFARLYLRIKSAGAVSILRRSSPAFMKEKIDSIRYIWKSFYYSENDVSLDSKNLKIPVLMFFGRFDPVIPAWSDGVVAQKSMPSSKLVVLPCGHAAFAELPHVFKIFTNAFLRLLDK